MKIGEKITHNGIEAVLSVGKELDRYFMKLDADPYGEPYLFLG